MQFEKLAGPNWRVRSPGAVPQRAATARLPTSRAAQASTSSFTPSAPRPPTSTTTAGRRLRDRARWQSAVQESRRGKFVDVTAKPASPTPDFSTSALWFDYDNDGQLDLFVAHYVQWTERTDLHCTLDGRSKSYCTPESYQGQSGTLYRNRGDGTFENVTKRAGLFDTSVEGARRGHARLRRRRLARSVRRQRHPTQSLVPQQG